MENIIDQFNNFFGKDAQIVIVNNNLRITIGNRTLIIELPIIVGTDSMAPLPKS